MKLDAIRAAALPDGQIDPSSAVGTELGFTSDKFDGWLWKTGDQIMVSFIVSKQERRGHLSALFSAIEARGLRIAVPTPFPRMESILKRKGFRPHYEHCELGRLEVWSKP